MENMKEKDNATEEEENFQQLLKVCQSLRLKWWSKKC